MFDSFTSISKHKVMLCHLPCIEKLDHKKEGGKKTKKKKKRRGKKSKECSFCAGGCTHTQHAIQTKDPNNTINKRPERKKKKKEENFGSVGSAFWAMRTRKQLVLTRSCTQAMQTAARLRGGKQQQRIQNKRLKSTSEDEQKTACFFAHRAGNWRQHGRH